MTREIQRKRPLNTTWHIVIPVMSFSHTHTITCTHTHLTISGDTHCTTINLYARCLIIKCLWDEFTSCTAHSRIQPAGVKVCAHKCVSVCVYECVCVYVCFLPILAFALCLRFSFFFFCRCCTKYSLLKDTLAVGP